MITVPHPSFQTEKTAQSAENAAFDLDARPVSQEGPRENLAPQVPLLAGR
jgi:hypothetical protein